MGFRRLLGSGGVSGGMGVGCSAKGIEVVRDDLLSEEPIGVFVVEVLLRVLVEGFEVEEFGSRGHEHAFIVLREQLIALHPKVYV